MIKFGDVFTDKILEQLKGQFIASAEAELSKIEDEVEKKKAAELIAAFKNARSLEDFTALSERLTQMS